MTWKIIAKSESGKDVVVNNLSEEDFKKVIMLAKKLGLKIKMKGEL